MDGIKVLVGVLPLGEQLLELVGPVSGVPEGRGLVPESPLLNRFHAGETGPGDVRSSNGRKSEKGRDLQRLVEKVSNLVKIDNESLANIIGLRSVGESREDGLGRAGRLVQQSVLRTLGQEAREVLAALFKGKAQPNVGWLVSTDGVIFVLSDGGLAKKLKESSQVGSVCKRMVEVDKENEPTLDEEENPEFRDRDRFTPFFQRNVQSEVRMDESLGREALGRQLIVRHLKEGVRGGVRGGVEHLQGDKVRFGLLENNVGVLHREIAGKLCPLQSEPPERMPDAANDVMSRRLSGEAGRKAEGNKTCSLGGQLGPKGTALSENP